MMKWDDVLRNVLDIEPAQLAHTNMKITCGAYEPARVNIEGIVVDGCVGFRGGKIPTEKLSYKTVIFNDPATIVLWEDGTKTVVKCDDKDTYNPTTGLALCFMKKALGNSSRKLNDVLHEFGL